MKKILALLTLIFSINAYALTVDDLVNRHGKQAIMTVIASKLKKQVYDSSRWFNSIHIRPKY